MVLSVGVHKKRILAVVILLAVVAGVVFLLPKEPAQPIHPALTNEERLTFLASFGWTVEEEPAELREVIIPAAFNDVYTAYNDMQNAQGFDLKPYAGETCTLYRYRITNAPANAEQVYATLLVYEGNIIGGDVAQDTQDGFMHGFAQNSAPYQPPKQKT